MNRLHLLVPIWLALSCMAEDRPDLLQRVDREFSGPPLQSVRPPVPGRLTEDGEGGCRELPYSACGYADGNGNRYYFNEGRLVVKEHLFSEARPAFHAPFGILRSDGAQAARRKIRRVTGRRDRCVSNTHIHVCYTLTGPNSRVDLSFDRNGRAQEVRFYISDFL